MTTYQGRIETPYGLMSVGSSSVPLTFSQIMDATIFEASGCAWEIVRYPPDSSGSPTAVASSANQAFITRE